MKEYYCKEPLESTGATWLAKLITNILNPQAMAMPMFWIVSYKSSPSSADALRWFSLLTGSIAIPALLFLIIQLKRGDFTDIHVSVRQQRTQLYVFVGICALVCLMIASYLHAPSAIIATVMATLVSNFVLMLINLLWKVSVHTGGITGTVLLLIILFGDVALPMILLIFIVGWARFALGKHTISQIVTGALVAAVSTVLVFHLFGLL